jgi:hypothetical protein
MGEKIVNKNQPEVRFSVSYVPVFVGIKYNSALTIKHI